MRVVLIFPKDQSLLHQLLYRSVSFLTRDLSEIPYRGIKERSKCTPQLFQKQHLQRILCLLIKPLQQSFPPFFSSKQQRYVKCWNVYKCSDDTDTMASLLSSLAAFSIFQFSLFENSSFFLFLKHSG